MNEETVEYAGFWIRVGASLIDTLLLMAILFPLLKVFYGDDYLDTGAFADQLVKGPADLLLSYVLPAIAVIVFWLTKQATPGKMIVGARVVDARTGQTIGTGQAIGRYLGYYVSMLPLCLGLFWVGFDPRKQGWHDKLAGTVVIRSKRGGTEPVRFDPP